MKNITLFLFLFLLLDIAFAEQLRCDYGNGIIRIVEFYQCPPVLKVFYKLQLQSNYSENIYAGGYGGGGGGAASPMPMPETEGKPLEKRNNFDWVIIPSIIIFICLLWWYAQAKKLRRKRNDV